MPSSIQKKQRSTKLFQCTGYGDCKMVFTRGEHLARHVRKHTGEKPFPCIIPDCNKSFSRFDNMMQHTQTHRREFQSFELEQQQLQQQQQRYSHYQQQPRASTIVSNEKDSRIMLHQPSSPMNYSPDIISNYHERSSLGSESPASLSSASMMDSGSSSEDDYDDYDDEAHYHQHRQQHHHHHDVHDNWMDHSYRRLSVADMCNPMDQPPLKGNRLTNDEVEVIQAFGQLRQAT
ncbi:hypothetical protein BCR42DRAFT_414999 [Absidia repens]|uniref:C2H2-type domain-containing protein n=1 Tax=Absidia repens TaxID=90262 RepID=A0A1X2IH46_9FUNG|nr:hypothetical protein BCR42DRAFT_414999 [Absidia repens]